MQLKLFLFPAHEIPYEQKIALETNLITDSYDGPAKHFENHESFVVCPGKQPIKIGANYPVSIHIYFHNFVSRQSKNHRKRHEGDNNGDIYLHITEGFPDSYNNGNNQQNNRINDHELIIKRKNAING